MKYLWLAFSLVHLACASGETVTRRRGEIEQVDRRISPVAYAWYARGTHHERQGDLERAAAAFRSALEYDPESGSTWASLGRVLCTQGDPRAAKVFEKGLRKAERHAPLLLEQARCELSSLTPDALPPHQKASKIATLCARAEAILELEPSNPSVTEFLVRCWGLAEDHGRAQRIHRAGQLYLAAPHDEESAPSLGAIDQALWDGDLERARQLALTELTPGALAARAALWGKTKLARAQAQLVLDAAPDDADSLVTLVALGEVARAPTEPQARLSALGVLVFGAHLRRTIGKHAAAQFLTEHDELLRASDDPLVRRLLRGYGATEQTPSAR